MPSTIVAETHATETKVQRYYTWRASNYDAGTHFEAKLESAGFIDLQRFYRPSRGLLVSRLWGQEILLARKFHPNVEG